MLTLLRILFVTVISYLLLASGVAHTKIIEIDDISEMSAYIDVMTTSDLLIFDVDDVLIQPLDILLASHNRKYIDNVVRETEEKYSKEESENILSIIWYSHKVQLVDSRTPTLIKYAHNKSIKVIALTKANTGKYGVIASIEKSRAEQLNDLGVSFKNSAGHALYKKYAQLTCKHSINHPSYYKGIIYTCGLRKPDVLDIYLKDNDLSPHGIVFIDDRYDNLQEVEEYCALRNINFTGFHYVAVLKQSKQAINEGDVRRRVNTLYEKRVWLDSMQ